MRRYTAYDATDRLYKAEAKKDVARFGIIERVRTVGERASTERGYYIGSLPSDAERLALAVRSHWEVENRLHWCLDVQFDDELRARAHCSQLGVVTPHCAQSHLARYLHRDQDQDQAVAGRDIRKVSRRAARLLCP